MVTSPASTMSDVRLLAAAFLGSVGREVVGWVVLEETLRLEHEAEICGGHDWIVLGARHMRMTEGVPQDQVAIDNRSILLDPLTEPFETCALIGVIARRVAFRG